MKKEIKKSTVKTVNKKSSQKEMDDFLDTLLTKEPAEKKQKPKLANIKLEKLHPFEGHPYKVIDDESMEELKESIKEKGLLNRIIVRPLENTDEYEIISGHRRVHAAELLGIKEVPAVIYFIDRNEATVLMVDSNCQRDSVSPIEKGKAYKMKFDALSHQGKATSGQFVPKSDDNRTTAQIGADAGESYKTVQRFIRLTYLTPELQEYVDTGKMKVSPAVEISFLDEERQRDIVDCIEETDIFPSHAQTRRMRQLDTEGKLDYDSIKEIMSELKPNQVEKLKIPMDSIRRYAPKGATPKDIEELVVYLMKQNYERQCRMRDDGAR
ncbi:MAG: ParB/RepB/Spo0J family partition protein [Clostridia bacterium]|nr:ParB/RepB/Spo0J family partition protein [Clostridia bacterium]